MSHESDYHMSFIERTALDTPQSQSHTVTPHLQTAKDVLMDIVKLCTDTSRSAERETMLGPHLPNFVLLGKLNLLTIYYYY